METRRSQICQKSRQHDTDCAARYPSDDGNVFLHVVSRVEQEGPSSEPGRCGQYLFPLDAIKH